MACTLSGVSLARGEKRITAKGCQLRLCSVNVGSMVGRSGEVVEMVGRRILDFCCLQETGWCKSDKGGRGEEKLLGVGILVVERWIKKVIEVRRFSEKVMLVRVLVGKQVINILSAYAPQSGNAMEDKEEFRVEIGKVIDRIDVREDLVLCGDLNGHVGRESAAFEQVHRGHGYEIRNIEGDMLLEFADSKDLVVLNTMFSMKNAKKITFDSGGNKSQIDYILMRTADRNLVHEVKVIPCEPCLTQHRLLVCVHSSKEVIPLRKKKVFISRCKI